MEVLLLVVSLGTKEQKASGLCYGTINSKLNSKKVNVRQWDINPRRPPTDTKSNIFMVLV